MVKVIKFGIYLLLQNLATLLYKAASECGYVIPDSVEQILNVSEGMVSETETSKPNGKSEKLTPRQISRLAATISVDDMTTIAESHMQISKEIIKGLKDDNRFYVEASNKQILKHWSSTNPDGQVKVSES